MTISSTLPHQISTRLGIDSNLTRRILVDFIAQELHKVGMSRVVFGLSGGIDSALVCYLAAAALGAENVMVVRMPYRSSAESSYSDAQLIIDDLGVQTETVEITSIVDPLFALSPNITAHRKGNVMARARMMILYDRSAELNALVLGTSNKTELLLGYGTVFGDLAHAINPIGDLYKTQVRQLARAMNVPERIITKPPSADLIPNQTDEDDFGFSYEEGDRILYLLVDERYSAEEVVARGYPEATVQRIMKMIQRNHYKRTQPIIPKLSERTIGHDFLYLRNWGN